MYRFSFRRRVATLALGLILVAPLASALERPSPRSVVRQSESTIWSAWDLRLHLFWDFIMGSWSKNGCQFDPNGRCLSQESAPPEDGCQMDPNSGCVK